MSSEVSHTSNSRRALRHSLFALAAASLLPLAGCSLLETKPKTPSIPQVLQGEDTRDSSLVKRNMLKDDERSRERGMLALGRIGNPSDRGILIEGLKDPSPRIRATAAFALGEMGDKGTRAGYGAGTLPGATSALLPLVNDESDDVRANVAEALGKIGELSAVQPLIGYLLNPQESRSRGAERATEFAMMALVRIGSGDAIQPLRDMTLSPNARLRFCAGNALLRMPGKFGREEALRLLDDEYSEVRAIGVRLLGKTGEPADAMMLFEKKNDDAYAVFLEMILAQGKLKNPDYPKILRPAIEAITTRATKDADMLRDGKFVNIAVTTIDVLAEFDPLPEAWDQLQTLRAQPNIIGYRAQSTYAKLIARSNSNRRFSDLPKDFRADTPESMRALILAWGELPPDRAFAELPSLPFAKLARIHLEENAQEAESLTKLERQVLPAFVGAYGALELKLRGELNRSFVLYHLWSDDPLVRAYAASLLIPEAEDVLPSFDYLQAAIEVLDWDRTERRDPNPDGRLALVRLLDRFPELTIPAQEALTRSLNDPSPIVRSAAMAALGRGSDADFNRYLTRLPGTSRVLAPEESKEGYYYRLARAQGRRTVVAMDVERRGRFAVELFPADAPATCENFLKLARKGYFTDLTFHRVVPDFVAQGGDPRNDMEGGPGYSIPCEMNMRRYRRGTLGMALSGKDTGGSQFFVTLSPQPHLEGGYTVFGQVLSPEEAKAYSPELSEGVLPLEALDEIVQFDRIESVRYIVPGPL